MPDHPMSRNVYVVDDDRNVRTSTAFFLKSAGYVPWPYNDGRQFLEAVSNLSPGCVLLDLRMQGVNGLEVVERLHGHRDELPIIMFTAHGDVGTAVKAMKLGAVDFIEKPFAENDLLLCLHRGFDILSSTQKRRVEEQAAKDKLRLLSHREREIFDAVILEKPNKIIAHDLGLSVRTVEMHRANMMEKLQAKSVKSLLALRPYLEANVVTSKDGHPR